MFQFKKSHNLIKVTSFHLYSQAFFFQNILTVRFHLAYLSFSVMTTSILNINVEAFVDALNSASNINRNFRIMLNYQFSCS